MRGRNFRFVHAELLDDNLLTRSSTLAIHFLRDLLSLVLSLLSKLMDLELVIARQKRRPTRLFAL